MADKHSFSDLVNALPSRCCARCAHARPGGLIDLKRMIVCFAVPPTPILFPTPKQGVVQLQFHRATLPETDPGCDLFEPAVEA